MSDVQRDYTDAELAEGEKLLERGREGRRNVLGELRRARQVVQMANSYVDGQVDRPDLLKQALDIYNKYMDRPGYDSDV